MPSRIRLVRLAITGAALLAAAVVVAYLRFPARDSTEILDHAPISLVVPRYYDPIFFRGQGFPVRRSLVTAGRHEIDGCVMHVLPLFDSVIDYKSTQDTAAQVDAVNARWAPRPPWRFRPERRLGHYRCMATSTSMVLDWFRARHGHPLGEYVSVFDGRRYRGFDPRAIDDLYLLRAERDPEGYPLTNGSHLDPVTSLPVPFSIAGFARIVEEDTTDPAPRSFRDPQLPIEHTIAFDGVGSLKATPVLEPKLQWRALLSLYPRDDSERVREALDLHGPLLAGIKIRFSALNGVFRETRLGDFPVVGASGHGVVIVGWIEKNDRLYFLYRETFGACDDELIDCGPAYRIYPVYGFNEIFAFTNASGSLPDGATVPPKLLKI